jgi:hypothetical protein
MSRADKIAEHLKLAEAILLEMEPYPSRFDVDAVHECKILIWSAIAWAGKLADQERL